MKRLHTPGSDKDDLVCTPTNTRVAIRDQGLWVYDVGAMDFSDTKRFMNAGFNVVAFEPNEALQVPNVDASDRKLITYSCCVGSEEGKMIELVIPSNPLWSTTSALKQKVMPFRDVRKVMTQIRRLDNVIREVGQIPYYLKIDTEGTELEVLASLGSFRPEFISVECQIVMQNPIRCVDVDVLVSMGYTRFKLFSQQFGVELSADNVLWPWWNPKSFPKEHISHGFLDTDLNRNWLHADLMHCVWLAHHAASLGRGKGPQHVWFDLLASR